MTQTFRTIKSLIFALLVPLIYFFNLVIIWTSYKTTLFPENQILGVSFSSLYLVKQYLLSVVIFVGLLLWLSGYLYVASSFSAIPQTKKLVAKGPYKFFRHPIYLGIFLTFVGLSLIVDSRLGLYYAIFIVFPLNYLRKKNEEKVLEEVFGDKYRLYKQITLFNF